MLKEGSIIKLGGKYEYVVVFSTTYKNSNYIFVTNIDTPEDSCFYENDNSGRLHLVKDCNVIKALLELYENKN